MHGNKQYKLKITQCAGLAVEVLVFVGEEDLQVGQLRVGRKGSTANAEGAGSN